MMHKRKRRKSLIKNKGLCMVVFCFILSIFMIVMKNKFLCYDIFGQFVW